MKNITIRQLRYFESLAAHCHFGRAAAACSVSQPALSVQIAALEAEVDATLFERGARHVRLTGFGEVFSDRVRAILEQLDELGDLARAAKGQLIGRLRLGIIPTIAPYILPNVVARLKMALPGLDIHVRETLTDKLLEELSSGRLDAAVVALPISEPGLTETALFSEDFVLVRPCSQADEPVPDLDGLQKMRLLLLEEGHCFRDQALSFCNTGQAAVRDGLDGSSLSTLVQMVGAGLGVTLIPEMAVAVEARSAPVSVSRFEGAEPGRLVGMIWRKTNPLAEQFGQIADIVRLAATARRDQLAFGTDAP